MVSQRKTIAQKTALLFVRDRSRHCVIRELPRIFMAADLPSHALSRQLLRTTSFQLQECTGISMIRIHIVLAIGYHAFDRPL